LSPFPQNPIVAVIGLGYVGLPLAVEFGKKFRTIGFDLSQNKIEAYQRHIDPTGEVATQDLMAAVREGGLEPTTDPRRIASADFLIIAVPTPVDAAHIPDFGPLISASTTTGQHMKKGATVIYESTVYPGATEEICVPVLEKHSGMKWACAPRPHAGEGPGERGTFHVGYSPERINPGDKEHTLTKILKVVSGDSAETLERVAALYGSIITAGVHKASSIKVAEAAKVIENTQRDLNISLMNELAIIFDRIGIDTTDVLEAAGTKWNFLKFKPGLVGGHCIGVDPYYLTHKAEMLGYHPQVILAGRRINDGMGKFIAEKTIKLMSQQGTNIKGAKVSVLGLTFKEDCPDLRNSKVMDVIRELQDFGCEVVVHDPLADPQEALNEYGLVLASWDQLPTSDAVVIAVAHSAYRDLIDLNELQRLCSPRSVVIDVKSFLAREVAWKNSQAIWRL
jgi:UDP-N-acetyl-D-galactosamine dehydrogenase